MTLAEGSLEGRVLFVTGASQGLGREIAVTAARYGADVALAARSDGIYETADAIDADVRALPVECDVTDEDAVEAAIDECVRGLGGLDCLVNNAGIAGPTAPVEEVSLDAFEETLHVNLSGAFLCAKHAAPHLRESDCGSVVNVSSVGGKRPYPNRTPYASSKLGMVGLGRALAFEFADDDVTVNTVCPGPVRGDRIEAVIEAQAEKRDWSVDEAREELYTGELALNEMVDPSDVADQVAYLASDAARHITAQDINVDSGMTWY